MDTLDLVQNRIVLQDSMASLTPLEQSAAFARMLSHLPPRALVIGIETDGLFTTTKQLDLAAYIPDAEFKLVIIASPDGHDGFLLEFEQIN
jgi:homoserine O-acetyltransferase